MPVLLEALALSKEYRLQYLASETVLNLAYAQVSQFGFSCGGLWNEGVLHLCVFVYVYVYGVCVCTCECQSQP